MKNDHFKSPDFLKSQGYARNGVKLIFRNERNFRIDIVIAVLVVIAGFLFKISHTDWIAISLVISMVFTAEVLNSAIEALCDTVSQDFKVNIKYAKDVSAGAVLISALVSIITGLIVFLPYIMEVVKNILV
ncbi:MAG TPA: diacylglycerol kinase family protein [Candidatus Dojkabacteria bacterium]|jgi:diacylglycerol kinase|nr:diacylglycerol kinase family protein [Candidatus Dojkabacteria bacterium]HOF78884.1 diacylglycerol kinase family protein [Candidatus Dojkabacteria bacterium]HOR05865.1 diacylglycerol kinase family protein [Candidatus Dojkabacteria bacterium]HQI92545.1 diacylglycerol kinase family protein [Candidatus Dojkabacteria bacterium]